MSTSGGRQLAIWSRHGKAAYGLAAASIKLTLKQYDPTKDGNGVTSEGSACSLGSLEVAHY